MATTSGIIAGKAFVIIEALDKTGKVLGDIKNRLGKFGSDISQMGQTMALRMAAALAPVALSTKAFVEFDDIMKIIEARSRGTADEMRAIRQQALDLGEATAFTSAQIGQLQAKLAQKKFNRSDILAMTEPIMNLARAAGDPADLGLSATQAADATTGVLRSFQMEASQASRVADLLALTVNNSNFTLEELIVSLQYAAPAANQFKDSLEETLAVLAAMRSLNIDASISGTAFRNMFLYTGQSKERDEFNRRLHELTGKSIDFSKLAQGGGSLIDVLIAINDATKDLDVFQRADLITGLFETRASIPAGAVGKSVELISELLTLFKEADGYAKRTADKMESGVGGAWRQFESKVERLALAIGDTLAMAITKFLNLFGVTITSITEWIEKNTLLVGSITALAVGFLLLGVVGVLVGQSLRMIGGAFLILWHLSTGAAGAVRLLISLFTMLAGMGPVGWAVLAATIVLIGTVILLLRSYWSEISAWFARISKGMSDAIMGGNIKLAFEILFKELELIYRKGADSLLKIWEGMLAKQKFGVANMFQWYLDNFTFDDSEFFNKEFREAHRATLEGLKAENDTGARDRALKISELETTLREMYDLAAKLKQERHGEADNPITNFAQKMQELLDRAKNIIVPGRGPTIGIPPTINKASSIDTLQGLQDFQENRFNQFTQGIKDLIGEAKIGNDMLGRIEQKLGMEGV